MNAPAPPCPHCGSSDIETVSAWGGQLITSQARCRRCNTYFEAIRDVFAREAGVGDPVEPTGV